MEDNGRELLMYYLFPEDTCTMTLTCCLVNQNTKIRAVLEGELSILAIPINFMSNGYFDLKIGKFL